jgi:hypothetical protein
MLEFDIDGDDLERIAHELGASEKQIKMAFNRALSRTAAALRRLSSTGLQSELELRTAAQIRKRIKQIRLRRSPSGLGSIRLWYGANDLPVSAFKGRPQASAGGASFRGVQYDGGFVQKNKAGRQTIFRRVGDKRLPIAEQTVPVKDQIDVFLEDRVFDQLDQIFFKNFRADLRARTIYGVGG